MAYLTADATAPAHRGAAVTPNDSTEIECTRSLWVGGAGDVAIQFVDRPGTSVTLVGVPAGTLLPVQAVRVMATGTTATSIVALY